ARSRPRTLAPNRGRPPKRDPHRATSTARVPPRRSCLRPRYRRRAGLLQPNSLRRPPRAHDSDPARHRPGTETVTFAHANFPHTRGCRCLSVRGWVIACASRATTRSWPASRILGVWPSRPVSRKRAAAGLTAISQGRARSSSTSSAARARFRWAARYRCSLAASLPIALVSERQLAIRARRTVVLLEMSVVGALGLGLNGSLAVLARVRRRKWATPKDRAPNTRTRPGESPRAARSVLRPEGRA